MIWGLTTVMLSPRELFHATKQVYLNAFPSRGWAGWGSNVIIELPWWTLPSAYHGHGIGLPDFGLLSLAAKLQLIQCIWGFKAIPPSIVSAWVMSPSLLEIGMYGITPCCTIMPDSLSLLQMECGLKMFGNCYTNTMSLLVLSVTSTSVRIGDCMLMNKFSKFYYCSHDMASLNVFHPYKKD